MSVSVAFRLKRPNQERPTAVIVDVAIDGGRVRSYTGISVLSRDWDRRRQCLKRGAPMEVAANQRLTQIRARIEEFESQALLEGKKVDSNHLQALIKQVGFLEEEENNDQDILAATAAARWIEAHGGERAPSTLEIWKSFKNHLLRFDESRDGTELRNMDEEWVESFISYLRRERNLCDNALWKVLRTWRAFSRWAEKKGYTVHPIYKDIKGTRFNIRTAHSVRLTKKQFEHLQTSDLSHEPALENVRRLFLLQCCLGVRYSDLHRILSHPETYMFESSIRLRTKKTDTPVIIPLLPLAIDLLNTENRPHPISNQKYNEYLKLMGEAVGFTMRATTVTWHGKKMIEKHLRLCDLLSSHAAKRTFVTLMTASGVRTETIMKITGNSRATIDRYVHLNDNEIESELREKASSLFSQNKGVGSP